MSSASQLLFPSTQGRVYNQPITEGWTPSVLFTGTEEGAWYDFSDTDVLYQDSARTTNVVSDGDPILGVEDKSGNGHHMLQISAGTSNVIYTNEGSDVFSAYFPVSSKGFEEDLFSSAWNFLHRGTEGTVAVALSPGLSSNPDSLLCVCSTISALSASYRGFGVWYDDRSSIPFNDNLRVYGSNGSVAMYDTNNDDALPAQTKSSFISLIDAQDVSGTPTFIDRCITYKPSGQLPKNNAAGGAVGAAENRKFTVGATHSLHQNLFEGYIYQIVVLDRDVTETERDELFSYFNRKMFG